jgi:hypothetical protein
VAPYLIAFPQGLHAIAFSLFHFSLVSFWLLFQFHPIGFKCFEPVSRSYICCISKVQIEPVIPHVIVMVFSLHISVERAIKGGVKLFKLVLCVLQNAMETRVLYIKLVDCNWREGCSHKPASQLDTWHSLFKDLYHKSPELVTCSFGSMNWLSCKRECPEWRAFFNLKHAHLFIFILISWESANYMRSHQDDICRHMPIGMVSLISC